MIVMSETNINALNTQVPCVNSCCAHRFGEPALSPDAAASPGWERREERSFSPWWSRRTHRGCHARRRPPLWTRWSTWRTMTARSPSFIPRSKSDHLASELQKEEVTDKSHIKRTFLHKIRFGLCLIYRKVEYTDEGINASTFPQTVYL